MFTCTMFCYCPDAQSLSRPLASVCVWSGVVKPYPGSRPGMCWDKNSALDFCPVCQAEWKKWNEMTIQSDCQANEAWISPSSVEFVSLCQLVSLPWFHMYTHTQISQSERASVYFVPRFPPKCGTLLNLVSVSVLFWPELIRNDSFKVDTPLSCYFGYKCGQIDRDAQISHTHTHKYL